MQNKRLKTFLLCVLILGCILVSGWHCPIQEVFGIPCPGCNMTTALYYFLKGEIELSIWYHAMLIPTAIFLVLGWVVRNNPKQVKILLWVWIFMMILYYIYRMIVVFPQPPMVYDSNNFLKIVSEKVDFQNIRSIIQSNK